LTLIKINLRTRFVQVFDHSADGQLQYFKERIVANSEADKEQVAFSTRLKKSGIQCSHLSGPSEPELLGILQQLGLTRSLRTKAAARNSPRDSLDQSART